MYSKILGVKKLILTLLAIIILFVVREISQNNISTEIGIIVSLTTFIYGFFVNSLFKFVEQKYRLFKVNMAEFSGNAQALYNIALLSNQATYIRALQESLTTLINKIKNTAPELYEHAQNNIDYVFLSLKQFKILNKKQTQNYSRSLQLMAKLAINREKLELFGDKYLVGEMKFLFFFFPVILSLMIILMSWNNLSSFIMGCVLIVILAFTTMLIKDIDSLEYGEYSINTKNLQQLLDMIQKKKKLD